MPSRACRSLAWYCEHAHLTNGATSVVAAEGIRTDGEYLWPTRRRPDWATRRFFSPLFAYEVRRLRIQRVLLCVGVGLLLAGCGGGNSGGSTPNPVVTPGSDRPNTSGTVAAYSGSLTETQTNNVIYTNPLPSPIATTGPSPTPGPVSATENATVVATIATGTSGTNTTYTLSESDAFQLETQTSTTVATVAFQAGGGGTTDVRALSTVENDSNGSTFSTTFGATNGLLDVIPEANGSFTNTAAETYAETDPGQTLGANGETATDSRTVNADGSYTESVVVPVFGITDSNQVNSDFSAVEELLAFGGGYEFSAPAAGSITYGFYPANGSGTGLTTPPEFTAPIPDWIPATQTTPSMETDTIQTGATLDARCAPAATYSGTPNLVKQTLTVADSAQGTLETRVTQSFDVAGIGTVCSTVDDTINGFYDYSGQEGPYLLVTGVPADDPITTIGVSEVLSLSSINGSSKLSSSREAAALSRAGTAYLPRSLALASVEHRVHQALLRKVQEARRAAAAHAFKGVAK